MTTPPTSHQSPPPTSPMTTPPTSHQSPPPTSPKPAYHVPRTDAARWVALTSRNPAYASSFIYAVTTTKIYCRPNCPSRLARRANIEFFAGAGDAAKAGYRSCKRCKPDQGDNVEDGGVAKVKKAVDIIKERAGRGEKISLTELSKGVGLSKWHLQRVFKRRVGVSPREMGEELGKGRRERGRGGDSLEEGEDGESEREGEMFPLAAQGSSEDLTDSNSTDVSSLSTPLATDSPWCMDWLTGSGAAEEAERVMPLCEQNFDFADTSEAFEPDVEALIRDLFPEIYEGRIDR